MKLKKNAALWALLAVLAVALTGCGGGGDAGGASALGYRVDLSVTQTVVSPGGTTTLIATVTLHGLPAPDGTTVTFSSSLGGTIGDTSTDTSDTDTTTSAAVSTISGTVAVVYTAPAEATGTDIVTATAMDAYDTVEIYVRTL